LQDKVQEVQVDSDPLSVGDEPLLLRRRSGLPVFVGHRRAEAAQALLQQYPQCDVIICDDGLQHYALARDVEIALLDGRGVLNGFPLPAGPLREPFSRMQRVDAVVLNELPPLSLDHPHQFKMKLVAGEFYLLDDPAIKSLASDLAGLRLHAIAGIGNPQRFFSLLETQGLDCCLHAFPDHHRYVAADLAFQGDAILTTEKDAVKLAGLVTLPIWVLPVEARVEPDLARFVLEKLNGLAPA
jgi:tetraacyldisaccharide 4'-kinase